MKAGPSGLPKDQYWFEAGTHEKGLILATSG